MGSGEKTELFRCMLSIDKKKPHDTFERCVMATHSLFGQFYHYITIVVLPSLFGYIFLRIKLSYLYDTFRIVLVLVFEK